MHKTDYIVVGGGIIGCSIAFHLSKMSKRVILIEQNVIGGGGATSMSRGIVRVYDEDPVLMDWATKGLKEYQNWNKDYFGDSPFTESGCFYLTRKENLPKVISKIVNHNDDSIEFEILDENLVKKHLPYIKQAKEKIAIYEPKGGYGNPKLTAQRLADGIKSFGNVVLENCKVVGFEENEGSVQVNLEQDSIEASKVIFALGAFTNNFFETNSFVRTIPLTLVKNEEKLSAPIIDDVIETFIRPEDSIGAYCGSRAIQDCKTVKEVEEYGEQQSVDALSRIEDLIDSPSTPITGFQGYDSYVEDFRPEFKLVSKRVYSTYGMSGRAYKYALAYGKHIAKKLELNNG